MADDLTNVDTIFSTGQAFAALKTDGSVVTWGDGGTLFVSCFVCSFGLAWVVPARPAPRLFCVCDLVPCASVY